MLFAVERDLVARVLPEQHAIALLHVHGDQVALVVAVARAGRDDLALGRLLLGGVGDDDPPRGLLLFLDALHNDAVVKRTNLAGHVCLSLRVRAAS